MVQFKMGSMRSEKPMCAPPRLSEVSPTLPLKQSHSLSLSPPPPRCVWCVCDTKTHYTKPESSIVYMREKLAQPCICYSHADKRRPDRDRCSTMSPSGIKQLSRCGGHKGDLHTRSIYCLKLNSLRQHLQKARGNTNNSTTKNKKGYLIPSNGRGVSSARGVRVFSSARRFVF